MRRWPLIDRRNVERFVVEKRQEDVEEVDRLRAKEEARSRSEAAENESGQAACAMDGDNKQQSAQPLDERKEAFDTAAEETEERKEGAVAERSAVVDEQAEQRAGVVPSLATDADMEDDSQLVVEETKEEATADGEETEEEEPTLAIDEPLPARKNSKQNKKAVWTWTKKSKKRRPSTATSPTAVTALTSSLPPASPPPPPPPRSLSAQPAAAATASVWTEPAYCDVGHFTPTFLLGNRVHFFDLQTRIPRDGELLSYSATKHSYQGPPRRHTRGDQPPSEGVCTPPLPPARFTGGVGVHRRRMVQASGPGWSQELVAV